MAIRGLSNCIISVENAWGRRGGGGGECVEKLWSEFGCNCIHVIICTVAYITCADIRISDKKTTTTSIDSNCDCLIHLELSFDVDA